MEYNSEYFKGKMSNWTEASIKTISNRLLATLKNESFPKEGIVLDYGCGNGAYFPYLQQSSLDVVGMDISPEAVKQASHEAYDAVLLIDQTVPPFPGKTAS